MKDFKPSASFESIELFGYFSRYWFFLAGIMILGGLVGFFVSLQKPPLYESNATFSVTIDYSRTGALTDIQEDQAMRGVGSQIFSDKVIQNTIQDLQAVMLTDAPVFFYDQAFLDRTDFRWTLRYRDADPERARMVADAWVRNADKYISEGLKHALQADAYLRLLDGLTLCLQRYPIDQTLDGVCGFRNLDELQDEIQSLSQNIQHEKDLSLGLFSHLSVDLTEHARLPDRPVQFDRNLLVFSGATSGLFFGLFLLTLVFLKRGSQA